MKAFRLKPNEYGRELGEKNVHGLAESFFPFYFLIVFGFLVLSGTLNTRSILKPRQNKNKDSFP